MKKLWFQFCAELFLQVNVLKQDWIHISNGINKIMPFWKEAAWPLSYDTKNHIISLNTVDLYKINVFVLKLLFSVLFCSPLVVPTSPCLNFTKVNPGCLWLMVQLTWVGREIEIQMVSLPLKAHDPLSITEKYHKGTVIRKINKSAEDVSRNTRTDAELLYYSQEEHYKENMNLTDPIYSIIFHQNVITFLISEMYYHFC